MKTVHKYTDIADNTVTQIYTKKGFKILHGDCQRGTLCVWAEVDDQAPDDSMHVIFVGTGHPIPDGFRFVNSFLMDRGTYVFHLYVKES